MFLFNLLLSVFVVVTLLGYYRTNALTTCRLIIAIIGQSTLRAI